ncbi:hypothetical protein ACHHYP_00015, partial [Achlya hypogyna]
MGRILGGDRSFRRLVLHYVFTLPSLPLLNLCAFYLWVFWLAFSFFLQLFFVPFERTGGVRGFWRVFVRENVESGFLEWLCRWEMRVRNLYAIKLYVDPTQDIVITPYLAYVAAYFIVWKCIEMAICGANFFSLLLLFGNASQARDGGGVITLAIIYAIVVAPFIFRVLAWAKVRCCEYCITPVFQPNYAYLAMFDEGMAEVVKDKEQRRLAPVAPDDEAVLGLSVVQQKGLTLHCIPVPDRIPKSLMSDIPILEEEVEEELTPRSNTSVQPSAPSLPSKDVPVAVQDFDDTVINIIAVPKRTLYYTEHMQSTVHHHYDTFADAYQTPPTGVYRSLDFHVDDHYHDHEASTGEYANLSTIAMYDVLSPTARKSQPFQLPR